MKIAERGKNGADLRNYDTAISCYDNQRSTGGKKLAGIEAQSSSLQFSFPKDLAPNATIHCYVDNTAHTATRKVHIYKQFDNRYAPTNNFRVNVSQGGRELVTGWTKSANTVGSPISLGSANVQVGSAFNVAELPFGDTDLTKYTTQIVCHQDSISGQIVGQTAGRSHTQTIPGNVPDNYSLHCLVDNKVKTAGRTFSLFKKFDDLDPADDIPRFNILAGFHGELL